MTMTCECTLHKISIYLSWRPILRFRIYIWLWIKICWRPRICKTFWDKNNLFEQWNVSTIFEIDYFLNLLLVVSTDRVLTLEQLKCQFEQMIGMEKPIRKVRNGILLPKLFWPTVRKIVLVIEKSFEIRGCGLRICKHFEISRTICLNSKR